MKPATTKIRIFIVDDHPMVLAGLRALLSRVRDFDLAGEAGSSDEALAALGAASPHIVLLDIRMPGRDGIDTCRIIKKEHPGIRVIMLTSYLEDDMVMGAIQAGADGYLLKEVDAENLCQAIRRVHQGHKAMPDSVTGTLLQHLQGEQEEQALRQKVALLSPQEKIVMSWVAEGLINKEIADRMNLSEKTVKNYLASIFVKLEVSRRAQVATFFTKYMQE